MDVEIAAARARVRRADDQRPRYLALHVDVPDVHVAEAERGIDPVRVLRLERRRFGEDSGEADRVLGRAKHRRRRRKRRLRRQLLPMGRYAP